MNSKTKKVLVPLVAIVFGFLLGAIIMLAFGYNPIWGYEDLFISALGNARAIGETLQTMGPLILTALSFESRALQYRNVWSSTCWLD